MTTRRMFSIKALILGAMFCLSFDGHGQNNERALVLRAVQCLVAKGFLPELNPSTTTVGFIVDKVSYPGQRMLYIVRYPSRSRSSGSVFTLFVNEDAERLSFDIQNNANFKLSKRTNEHVTFEAEPLGGMWVREHLMSAIEAISKRRPLSIATQDTVAVDPSTQCKAYTDTQLQ